VHSESDVKTLFLNPITSLHTDAGKVAFSDLVLPAAFLGSHTGMKMMSLLKSDLSFVATVA